MNVTLDSLLCYAGSGNDGAHRQINSFIWNSWTPDVAVTGGILDVDYASIVWPKINYLASPNLGLLPWYSPPTGNRGVRCLGLLLMGQDACAKTQPGSSLLRLQAACAVATGVTPWHTDSASPAACRADPESLGCNAEQKRLASWAPCPQHLTGPAWRSDCITAAALHICAANVSVSNAGQSSSGSSTSYIANLQASCNPAACNNRAACNCRGGSRAFWTPWAALADGVPTCLLEHPYLLTLPACFAVPCPFVEGLLRTHSSLQSTMQLMIVCLVGLTQGC